MKVEPCVKEVKSSNLLSYSQCLLAEGVYKLVRHGSTNALKDTHFVVVLICSYSKSVTSFGYTIATGSSDTPRLFPISGMADPGYLYERKNKKICFELRD